MPLSQKQMEYLALAWQCFETEPKIDYDRFKEVAGLASAASARELMRVTKKKLKEEYGALSGGVKGVNNGNTNGSATTSPVKKAPHTPAPKRGRNSVSTSAAKRSRSEVTDNSNSNSNEDDEDDDEEHLDTPIAKKIKTPATSTKKKAENGVVAVKKEPVTRDDGSDDDGDFLV